MKIEKILHPSEDEILELQTRFAKYVKSTIPDIADESEDLPFYLCVRDEHNHLIAGVSANIYWDGIEIDTLWVDERFRGTGLGGRLLRDAESFGIENGASIAFLKTVFATDFYVSQGYVTFGVLEDRPKGTCLYHMKKTL
jgi:GNAT superfamily N-acetyltransferase